MRKLLISLFIFFSAIVAIDFGIGLLGDFLQHHAKGGKTGQFDNLVSKDCHDVLVLGSSRALHHYDTPFMSDTLNLDVYNAGYKGHGIILADGILEMVLKHSRPKLILFDVEPAFDIYVNADDYNDKRYLAFLKGYYKDSEVGRIIKDISREEWYKAHSGMFRYNTSIITMFVDNIILKVIPSSGFVPLNGVMTEAPRDESAHLETPDTLKLKYVRRLIGLSQSYQIPVVFVASPKYGEKEDLSYIKEICLQYGVSFLDYYDSPVFKERMDYFQESVHLNAIGARVFSEMISNEIKMLIQQ